MSAPAPSRVSSVTANDGLQLVYSLWLPEGARTLQLRRSSTTKQSATFFGVVVRRRRRRRRRSSSRHREGGEEEQEEEEKKLSPSSRARFNARAFDGDRKRKKEVKKREFKAARDGSCFLPSFVAPFFRALSE